MTKPKATCATTAGYIYQAWPKGKPIPKPGQKKKAAKRRKSRRSGA